MLGATTKIQKKMKTKMYLSYISNVYYPVALSLLANMMVLPSFMSSPSSYKISSEFKV